MKYLKLFEDFSNTLIFSDRVVDGKTLSKILKGYIECALWTEEERLGEELAQEFLGKLEHNPVDFTDEFVEENSKIKSYKDIKKFIEDAGWDACEYAIEAQNNIGFNGEEKLGMDIWFTRNGHGSGFFDHNYDKDIEDKLSNAARQLKEVHLFISDDMKITFE